MKKILNYIDGNYCEPLTGQWLDNVNPATGKVYSVIADSGPGDVAMAIAAAKSAFPGWSQAPAATRSAILLKWADLLAERFEEFVRAESIDNGKPVRLSRSVDIPRAESNLRFFGTAILHFASEAHIMDQKAINYTHRKPIGLVACISPWNLPLYLFTWKIAPALAAGNCVIAKPSEITPMTASMLAGLATEAGFPPGVFNVLQGRGPVVGEALISAPEIKAISFTGGTKTGAHIASVAAPVFKKLSLELGGKNPNIVFADCDFEKMLETTVRSSFANQGQICLCGSRILVEKSIYEKFKKAFVEKVSRMQPGNPLDEETRSGAIASQQHMEKVLSYIQLAKEEGGTVLCGGHRFNPGGEWSEGYFIEPTVIEGLDENCRTVKEEIFGPVVTLQAFDSDTQAIQLANSTEYGLSATLWTSDLKRAHRVAAAIESGIVWINCWLVRDLRTPFGGVKNSGVGREGGWEALRFFTEPQNVCVDLES